MHQIQLSGFDQRMMDLLTLSPCPIAPTGHSPLIQTKRGFGYMLKAAKV